MIPFDHSVPAAIDAVDDDVASTLSLCTSLSSSCLSSSSSLLTATIPTATTIPTTARTSIYDHHHPFQFHVRSLQHEVRRLQQQRRRLMLLVMCLIVMAIVGSTTTDHIWWSASQQQGMNRSVVIIHRLEHGGNTTATATATTTTTTTTTPTKTKTATATSTTTTNTTPLLLRGGNTATATVSSLLLSFGTQNDTTEKTTSLYTSSFEQNGTSSSSSSATESYESPHHRPLLPFIAIAGWHDSRDDHDDHDDDDHDDDDNNSININNDDAGLSWRWDSWSLSWYTTTMRRFVNNNNNNTGYNNINSKNLTIATTTSSSSASAAAASSSSSSNTITRQQQHQQHQRQHQLQHQSIRLLPPLYVLRQYQQQHSVSVLRTELERQDGNGAQYLRQERQYVIAKFQCPYQAGMMSLPIQNGLLLAIVTNRTFILRYEGANGNIEANCRSILQFADWVPTYKEFGSIITADYHYEAESSAKKRTNRIKRKEKSKTNLLLVNPVHTRGSLQQPYFNKTEWAPEPLMGSDFAPSACHRFKKEYEQHDRNGHDDDDHDHAELSSWWYNSKRNQTWLSLLLEGSDDHIVVDPTDQQPPEEEAIVAKNRFSHTLLAQARVWKVSRIYIPSTPTRFWLDLREPCTAYRIPMLMDNNTKAGVISPMLPPLHLQQHVQQLYQQGIGFLFGMLFYSVVRIQPTVVDSISPSDWVLSSTSASSIAMHSRHSDVTLSGEDISTEKACLDYLITATTTTTTTSTSTTKPTTVSDQQQPSDVIANPKTSLQSCHVHLMSDRPVTVQRVAAYAHDRYHCQAIYTHNATPTNSFRASAEHGPAAGVGYYQDLLVVAAQARSAYMSHFRSSSFLPYATLEYTRRLAAWQQHLQQLQQHQQQQQHREKRGNLDVDDDVADDDDDDNDDDNASTDPWTWPNMPLCHLGNGRPFEIL